MALDSTIDSYSAKHGLHLELLNPVCVFLLQNFRQRTFQLTKFVANHFYPLCYGEYSDFTRASQRFPLHLEHTAYFEETRRTQRLATENLQILQKVLYLDYSASIHIPYFCFSFGKL